MEDNFFKRLIWPDRQFSMPIQRSWTTPILQEGDSPDFPPLRRPFANPDYSDRPTWEDAEDLRDSPRSPGELPPSLWPEVVREKSQLGWMDEEREADEEYMRGNITYTDEAGIKQETDIPRRRVVDTPAMRDLSDKVVPIGPYVPPLKEISSPLTEGELAKLKDIRRSLEDAQKEKEEAAKTKAEAESQKRWEAALAGLAALEPKANIPIHAPSLQQVQPTVVRGGSSQAPTNIPMPTFTKQNTAPRILKFLR